MHCNVTLLMSMNRGRQNSFYLAKGANAHYIIRLTQLNDFFFISINCPLLWIKFSWKHSFIFLHSFYCKMHEFSFKYIWYLSISFIICEHWAYEHWAYEHWPYMLIAWKKFISSAGVVERHLEAPLRILRIFSLPKWIWIFIEFNLYFHTFLSINQTNNSLISSFFFDSM